MRSEKSDRLQIEKKETLVIQHGKTLKKAQKFKSSKETKRKQTTKNLQDKCSPNKENVATTKKSKKQKKNPVLNSNGKMKTKIVRFYFLLCRF